MHHKTLLTTLYAVCIAVGVVCFLISLFPLIPFYRLPGCMNLVVTLANLGFTIWMVVLLRNSRRAFTNNRREILLTVLCLPTVLVWNYVYIRLTTGTL